MKRVTLTSDMFEFRGFVLFDCTHAQAAKWLLKNAGIKHKKLREGLKETAAEKENSAQGTTWSGDGNFYIWISESPYRSDHGKMLLAHEATHAALKVLKHWSIDPLDRSGDEVLAVLVGWITKKVFSLR